MSTFFYFLTSLLLTLSPAGARRDEQRGARDRGSPRGGGGGGAGPLQTGAWPRFLYR